VFHRLLGKPSFQERRERAREVGVARVDPETTKCGPSESFVVSKKKTYLGTTRQPPSVSQRERIFAKADHSTDIWYQKGKGQGEKSTNNRVASKKLSCSLFSLAAPTQIHTHTHKLTEMSDEETSKVEEEVNAVEEDEEDEEPVLDFGKKKKKKMPDFVVEEDEEEEAAADNADANDDEDDDEDDDGDGDEPALDFGKKKKKKKVVDTEDTSDWTESDRDYSYNEVCLSVCFSCTFIHPSFLLCSHLSTLLFCLCFFLFLQLGMMHNVNFY
jgi:hypothetical protein